MKWKPRVASSCILVTFKKMEMSVVGDERASGRIRLIILDLIKTETFAHLKGTTGIVKDIKASISCGGG